MGRSLEVKFGVFACLLDFVELFRGFGSTVWIRREWDNVFGCVHAQKECWQE